MCPRVEVINRANIAISRHECLRRRFVIRQKTLENIWKCVTNLEMKRSDDATRRWRALLTRPSSSHARGRLRRFCLLRLLLRDQRASSFSRRKNHSAAPSHCTAPAAAAVDAVAADDGEDRSANAFPISCKKKAETQLSEEIEFQLAIC